MINTIEYETLTIKREDFSCQTDIGYKDGKPIINIVVVVDKHIAYKLLKKHTITFTKPEELPATGAYVPHNTTPTTRDVWLPSDASIDMIMLDVVGEYNMMNLIGYIEFIPSDEAKCQTQELSSIRDNITTLEKLTDTKVCFTCNRHAYQCELMGCSKCHDVLYCSVLCQKINFITHKKYCKSRPFA